jgi:hypothetical protein
VYGVYVCISEGRKEVRTCMRAVDGGGGMNCKRDKRVGISPTPIPTTHIPLPHPHAHIHTHTSFVRDE